MKQVSDEQVAQIHHLFHAEHWKIGTIAAELRLHPDIARVALDTDRFRSHPLLCDRLTDPYLDFLRQTSQQSAVSEFRRHPFTPIL